MAVVLDLLRRVDPYDRVEGDRRALLGARGHFHPLRRAVAEADLYHSDVVPGAPEEPLLVAVKDKDLQLEGKKRVFYRVVAGDTLDEIAGAFGVPAAQIHELDWWEHHRIPGTQLTLTATPSQHFSGRGLKDGNRTLWSSWVIQGNRHSAFFSGDTGLTPEFAQTRERLGNFDLVMLEIGAFHPAWANIHLGPEQALAAHTLLGGGPLLPIHWGTFNLALHAWDDPVETLLRLAPKQDVPLLLPRLGAPVVPSQDFRIEPWWRGVDRMTETPPADKPAEPPAELPSNMPWPID